MIRADVPPSGASKAEAPVSRVIHRNISALLDVRQCEERRRTISERIADAITKFVGSMWCVYIHALLFGVWIIINLRLINPVPAFDPFPFVMLAVVTSVEAIFLGTFILITQNRMQRLADRRAEMDLQISLLAEHELTQAIRLLDDVARKLGVAPQSHEELTEAEKDIDPQHVAREIQRAQDLLEQSGEEHS